MENEKMYNIYYGDEKEDYVKRYLKDDAIIDGHLSEASAFDLFFDNMIMCNNYFNNNDFSAIDELISGYDEEDDYYVDEYQFFIVDFDYSEETIVKVVEKMGNTLYYDNDKDLYIMGVTDLGTSRRIVPTDIKVEESEM